MRKVIGIGETVLDIIFKNGKPIEALLAAGAQAGAKTQREVLPFGGTDASAMQTSRGGIPVCTLSIPCRYVHSACEVVDLRDIEGGVKLLNQYFQA